MKQIFQNLKTGQTEILEMPAPGARKGHVLIRSVNSVISSGTERMLVEFGRANLFAKAKQQPDKVRQLISKFKTNGLIPALEAVRAKLDQPLPMGYSNAGVILEVGPGVDNFSIGDRVVSNGPHAEIISVPKNLCAKIPDEVDDESAAFTTLGAIALQGIRLAAPTLGERFVVAGLGMIGLLTVQLLKAHGCAVLGLDFDSQKLEIAQGYGAETVDLSQCEDPVMTASSFSRGRGVDGVLIAASTESSEPIHQAAMMCRKRGRIVLVGVTGLELSRADFQTKELTFQVSCSYGPGRHDPTYEEKGRDYPFGFVRWTEQRNIEAVLELMANGDLDVRQLISHRFNLDQAQEAYELLEKGKTSIGILMGYNKPAESLGRIIPERVVRFKSLESPETFIKSTAVTPVVGFIGAGNFASRVLIPAFAKTGVRLKTVASAGVSSGYAGRKFGFEQATTDTKNLFLDDEINTVVIATRHDSHARFVCESLRSEKHVFVEKPIALSREELYQIESCYQSLLGNDIRRLLMVGFNRRFAPQTKKIKNLLETINEPKNMIMTVNAGSLPADHWTQDADIGGGRIIGEACHFIDLLRFIAGHRITKTQVSSLSGNGPKDNVTIILKFADGSVGTVHYLPNGHPSFPKERLEVFCAGKILNLDNFIRLKGYGWSGFRKKKLVRQDKGHTAEAVSFINAIRSGSPVPIPFEQIVEVAQITFDVAEKLINYV